MENKGGAGAAVAGIFTAVVICYFIFITVVYVGIIVVVCVIACGAFALARKHMECNTIKHCVDREYNYKMFKVDQEYQHKNRLLQAKYDRPSQQCIDSEGYSVEYRRVRRRDE